MSWLHCFWGLGASIGPYIMGFSESDAASWAALFYFGVMLGRGISGFVTGRLGDRKMIRIGQIVIRDVQKFEMAV